MRDNRKSADCYQVTCLEDVREQRRLIDVLTSSLAVQTRKQFIQWAANELRSFFPYTTLVCGTGYVDDDGTKANMLICIDHPGDFLAANRDRNGCIMSPIITRWLKTRRPQLFQPEEAQFQVPAKWIEYFRRHRLGNIAAHGLSDPGGRTGSYFSFTGIPERLSSRHAFLLEILVPPMHQALMRAIANRAVDETTGPARSISLSCREKEILAKLSAGKTTSAIARELKRSYHTVNNHLRRIFEKLGVNSRAQAVARAAEFGFLNTAIDDLETRTPLQKPRIKYDPRTKMTSVRSVEA